jgi:hypothetical protein
MTLSLKINLFLGVTCSGRDNVMVSPPFINVAEVAILPLTEI